MKLVHLNYMSFSIFRAVRLFSLLMCELWYNRLCSHSISCASCPKYYSIEKKASHIKGCDSFWLAQSSALLRQNGPLDSLVETPWKHHGDMQSILLEVCFEYQETVST